MAVDERAWRELERRLEEVLGEGHAMELMAHLPRGRPATKEDLDGVEARLGHRIDRLGMRMDGLEERIGGLETGMGTMEARLNERIDLKTQGMADRLSGELHKGLAAQARLFIFAMVGALASIAALGFAAMP